MYGLIMRCLECAGKDLVAHMADYTEALTGETQRWASE